jgi:hypothetical protein
LPMSKMTQLIPLMLANLTLKNLVPSQHLIRRRTAPLRAPWHERQAA